MAASMMCRRILHNFAKIPLNKTLARHKSSTGSYFIFIPEIPPDNRDTSPIMRYDEFPQFSKLRSKNVVSGCAKLCFNFDAKFDEIMTCCEENEITTFSELFNQMETVLAPLHFAEHTVKVLMLGNTNAFSREMVFRIIPQMTRSTNGRFYNDTFYKMLMKFEAQRDSLSKYQQRLLSLYLQEFKEAAVHIDDKNNIMKFNALIQKISDYEIEIGNKQIAMKATWLHDIPATNWSVIKDLPPQVRQAIAVDKANPEVGPWRASLMPFVYDAFLTQCSQRELRKQLWRGKHMINTQMTTDTRFMTTEQISSLRENRNDLGKVLGYENFAMMAMEKKMLADIPAVLSLLEMLKKHYLPIAKAEIMSLTEYSKRQAIFHGLRQWDIPYYRCLQCDHTYRSNNILLNPYFTYETVVEKMFGLAEKLFNIQIQEHTDPTTETWDKDVTIYDILDTDGSYMSSLYMDPHYRQDKVRTNFSQMGRGKCDHMKMTPLASIFLHLLKPRHTGVPTRMSYKEVLGLYFQFGQALQTLLTTVPYLDLADVSRGERDRETMCGHVMQYFAQQPSIIADFSEEYLSKEKLTPKHIENLLKANSHMTAFDMCYDLFYSAFDIEVHLTDDEEYWLDIHTKLYKIFMPIEVDDDDNMWCGEHDIWTDSDIAASHYSKIFSQLLASNVFDEFEKAGLDNDKALAEVGHRYRDTFLSKGAAVDGMTLFKTMTGREEPLLESLTKRHTIKDVAQLKKKVFSASKGPKGLPGSK